MPKVSCNVSRLFLNIQSNENQTHFYNPKITWQLFLMLIYDKIKNKISIPYLNNNEFLLFKHYSKTNLYFSLL